jgi:hypothetical protein
VSGNVSVTSGSGVRISGEAIFAYISGGTFSSNVSGNVVQISGQGVQISGQAVFVYISGGTFSANVSGNVVQISGQSVVTSVSGNVFAQSISGGSESGMVVWGAGTSGQTLVQTMSGSYVSVSGTVGVSISGGSISGQYVGGYSVGGYYPQNARVVVWGTAGAAQTCTFDVNGNINTRGAITTDEGAFRESFNMSGNVLYRQISGVVTLTNGSTAMSIVSGTFLDNIFSARDFVKTSGDIDNYYAQVDAIGSATTATLTSAYQGTTTTSGILYTSRLGIIQYYSGAYSIASSNINLGAGVTVSGQMFVFKSIDYLPFIVSTYGIVTQRISGQDAYIGFADSATNPGDFARFHFTGTSNGTVNCETGFSVGGGGNVASGNYDITAASIPSSGVTNSGHYYRIDLSAENATFTIDNITVATNRINIPNPYTTLNFYAGWQNGGVAPASSSQLYLDYVFANDVDAVQVAGGFWGQPIQTIATSGVVALISGSVVGVASGLYLASGIVVATGLSGASLSGVIVWGIGTSGQNLNQLQYAVSVTSGTVTGSGTAVVSSVLSISTTNPLYYRHSVVAAVSGTFASGSVLLITFRPAEMASGTIVLTSTAFTTGLVLNNSYAIATTSGMSVPLISGDQIRVTVVSNNISGVMWNARVMASQ